MSITPEKLTVKEIMSSPVITIGPTASVFEAAKIMAENRIGSLIVIEGGKPIGIITKTDLVFKVIATGRSTTGTVVGDIMSTPLRYVEPNVSLLEAARIMQKLNIRHLPVIKGDKVIGIITDRDILSVAPELIEMLIVRSKR